MLPSAAAAALLLLLSLGPASGRQLQQAGPPAQAGAPTAPLPTRVGVWASFFPLLYQDPPGSTNYVGEPVGEQGLAVQGAQGAGLLF